MSLKLELYKAKRDGLGPQAIEKIEAELATAHEELQSKDKKND